MRSIRRSILLLLLLLLTVVVVVVIDVGEGQEIDTAIIDHTQQQQHQSTIYFDGVVRNRITTEISVDIEPEQYFTFIEVNTTNVDAVWRLPSGNNLKLRKSISGKLLMLYDGNDSVGCRSTDSNKTTCRAVLDVRTKRRDVVPTKVTVLKGKLTEFGVPEINSFRDAKTSRLSYGMNVERSKLPLLVTLESVLVKADCELEIYLFDGFDFVLHYPTRSGERFFINLSTERAFLDMIPMPTTFMRVDVIARTRPESAMFLLRLDSNYFSVLSLTVAGAIGVAGLIAACFIASVCLVAGHRGLLRRSHNDAAPSVGLAPGFIDKISTLSSYAECNLDNNGDDACVICLDSYEQSDACRRIVCGHHFHDHCITKWLKLHRTCPLCQRILDQPIEPIQAVIA